MEGRRRPRSGPATEGLTPAEETLLARGVRVHIGRWLEGIGAE